jgi:KUP system potassium uptake protein
MLLHYVNQTKAVHEKVVILSVLTADVPEVEPSKRLETHGLGHGVYRVTAHSGFMETPDVPQILAQSVARGVNIDLDNMTYYMGRITLVPARKTSMPKWRRFMFTFMLRNAVSRATYLGIPPSKVIEIGVQMEF